MSLILSLLFSLLYLASMRECKKSSSTARHSGTSQRPHCNPYSSRSSKASWVEMKSTAQHSVAQYSTVQHSRVYSTGEPHTSNTKQEEGGLIKILCKSTAKVIDRLLKFSAPCKNQDS